MKFQYFSLLFCFIILISHPCALHAVEGLQTGIELLESGKIEEALVCLSAYTKENPSIDSAHLHYGHALFLHGDYKESIAELETAIELNDGVSEYHQRLGDACIQMTMQVSLLKKHGYAKKARKSWGKAVELDPDNTDARLSLVQFCLGAPGFMGGGKDKAKEQADEIVCRDSLMGHLAFAQIYSSDREYEKAESEYLKYLEAVPDDSMSAFLLGLVYHQAGKWEMAYDLFEDLVSNHPGWLGVWYQIGRTGALSGLYTERAEEALKHYIEIGPGPTEPTLANAHYRLGNVYEKAGRIAEAKADYETAIELDPDEKEFKKALKRCK